MTALADPLPSSPAAGERSLGWLAALFVIVYSLSLLTIGTGGDTRVLTRHEVLAAEPARQILRGQSWAVQSFAGQPRLVKPPTMSWLIAGCMWVTGSEAEWVARLPSAVAGVVLCVVVAWLAARLFGRTVGVMAGALQATMYYVLLQARLAEADMPLAAAVAIAMTTFAVACVDGPHRAPQRWWMPLLFHIATAIAFLLKGPVGPAFVWLGCSSYVAIAPDRRGVLRFLFNPIGIVVFLIIASVWPVAAVIEQPGIVRVWWAETIGRFQGDMGDPDRSDPIYTYLIDIPLLLLPWLPFVIGGAYHVLRYDMTRRPLVRFCLCWFIPGVILLTLSAWRHKHYAIPVLMPFTLLAARCLKLHLDGQMSNQRPRHSLFAILFAAAGAVAIVAVSRIGALRDARTAMTTMIAIAVAGGFAVILAEMRRNLRAELAALFATAWLVAIGALVFVMPHFDGYRASAEFGTRVTWWQKQTTDQPLYFVGLGEAHVAYYLKNNLVRIDDPDRFVQRLAEANHKNAYVLASDKALERLRGRGTIIQQIMNFDAAGQSAGTLSLHLVQFALPAATE